MERTECPVATLKVTTIAFARFLLGVVVVYVCRIFMRDDHRAHLLTNVIASGFLKQIFTAHKISQTSSTNAPHRALNMLTHSMIYGIAATHEQHKRNFN